MYAKRILTVVGTLATAVALLGVMVWTTAYAQAETAVTDLERISEETGFVAVATPLSPDCFFDHGYQVYLCEPPTPAERLQSNPAARARAMSLLVSGGGLFIINSTDKQLMVFDPVTGDLVDPVFIQLDAEATGTAIHAIISPNNTILISDQTRNVVHEYSFSGAYLGVFAPAGGANTSIMSNIRGMALRPNGNLLVTVAAGANADAVVEFDPGGAYVGNFIASGSGGLDSPYDVYARPNSDWLVSGIDNDQVIQYQWASGAPIGQFAAVSSFPQQIYDISNGNVLVANFSGAPGLYEFAANGTPIGIYGASGVSGYRGVYELPNGNLLTATSGGVYEIDRSGNLINVKHTGQSRFIEFVVIEGIEVKKTVGLVSSVCADTDEISVLPNTAVTYCFKVTNATSISLTRHSLVDSELGVIFNDLAFTLSPGTTAFITQTAMIAQTTVNTATWTAYNPGPVDIFAGTAVATVTVPTASVSLEVTVGVEPDSCATTNAITVAVGTAVVYCYTIHNIGDLPFSQHTVTDSLLGQIAAFNYDLPPGAAVALLHTHTILTDTVSTVTWLAEEGTYSAADADDLSVLILNEFRLYLPAVLKP